MSDQGRGNDDRLSKRAQGPDPRSAPPLGHIPLVLAWVRDQEARLGIGAENRQNIDPDQFELNAPPDDDEFDLPIPGLEPRAPAPAQGRHVLPPPAGSSRPLAASFPNPSTQRHSLPNSRPPTQRQSLSPGRVSQAPATSRSLGPPQRQSATPADDPRWLFGRALLQGGRKGEALLKLEELYYAQPEHEPCRTALLELYLEMRNRLNIKQHADWVVLRHLQANRATEACDTYRRARTACPEAEWTERTLALLTVAGDKLRDAQVVADATKLLMQAFPHSGFLPRALFATAHCQLDSGRADLARATLQHLTITFPMDAMAGLAEKKLRELLG